MVGCCDHDCTQEKHHHQVAKARAIISCPTGCCDESGRCLKKRRCNHREEEKGKSSSESDFSDDDGVVDCLAIIERNAGNVWVWDASGSALPFSIPAGAGKKLDDLCFHTHGIAHVDDLMTPCFDEDGYHGDPEEPCFCGLETPHLHAHVKDTQTCGSEENLSSTGSHQGGLEERLRLLATQVLHPIPVDAEVGDGAVTIPVSESMPIQCNSKEVNEHKVRKGSNKRRRFLVYHGKDHEDYLVHNQKKGQLFLEHPCDSCGESDVHGAFSPVGRRQWESSMNVTMSLNFFQIPQGKFHVQNHFPAKKIENNAVVRSTFMADGICCSSECPLITMLFEDEEGVKHIEFDVPKKLVMIDHIPSIITVERIVQMLNEEDFDATLCSTFRADGICCSAECPLITTLFEEEEGINLLECDVPKKLIMIQHIPSLIPVERILKILNDDGFDATLLDGNATLMLLEAKGSQEEPPSLRDMDNTAAATSRSIHFLGVRDTVDELGSAIQLNTGRANSAATNCRSCFYCEQICCASEIPAISQILEPLTGVSKVTINPTTRLIYVDHDFSVIGAEQICNTLGDNAFGSKIRLDGARDGGSAQVQSLFCTSIFVVAEGSRLDIVDENDALGVFLRAAFDKTQVDSFTFDRSSGKISIVHNPYAVSAMEIEGALRERTSGRVTLVVDGKASLYIDYAALAEQAESADLDGHESDQESRYPKPAVLIAGVLWIVSMLSLVGGNWEYLKYVGLLSVAFGLPPIAVKAWRTMLRWQFDTNCLMLFASVGALCLGEFTEAAAVVFLFALSEWLEVRATTRARQTLSAIVNLRPDKARLLNPETGELLEVRADAVPIGALVAVKTGDQIPCDGVVVEGQSTVDESSLTGESRPINKGPKEDVSGGTVNSGMSQLMVRTTASSENSAVARLIRLVEEAQVNRSETEKMVDEFAKYYTPAILIAALLMVSIPWAFGPDTGRHWTENGLVLIVVACPCALIISTPVSYVAGLAATASNGVLIKGGAFLESLGRVKRICFDKTGTLTNGKFALLHLETMAASSFSRTEVLEHLSIMEERASHPVADAILVRARNEGVRIPRKMRLQKHTLLAGEGVLGIVDGKEVYVGNERLFDRLGLLSGLSGEVLAQIASWKELGGTIGFMSVDPYGIVCAYCAADGVREESQGVVDDLKKRGIALAMLTGDNQDAALAVGGQVGLSPSEIHAKLLPEEKLAFVKSVAAGPESSSSILRLFKKKRDITLFCGDGVNDAPALAAADVGVAIGAGAALAMETADVTLLDSNLKKLEYSLQIGQRVVRTIWENVVFSITVKAIVLGFAIAGKTNLWAAIATDVGAMLLVTLNAIRILPKRTASGPAGSSLDIAKQAKMAEGHVDSPLKEDEPGITTNAAATSSCQKGCCGASEAKNDTEATHSKESCCPSESSIAQGNSSCTKKSLETKDDDFPMNNSSAHANKLEHGQKFECDDIHHC